AARRQPLWRQEGPAARQAAGPTASVVLRLSGSLADNYRYQHAQTASSCSGAELPAVEVLPLRRRELLKLDAHAGQLAPGHLAVDVLGHRVHPALELPRLLHEPRYAQGLVGEAHVHDLRRVAFGRAQVNQP